jgi:hypothetical protein
VVKLCPDWNSRTTIPAASKTGSSALHRRMFKNQGDSGMALISIWLVPAITAVPAMREFDQGN